MKNKNIDVMSQFNLPSYLKGKSFSEASALIAKRFEDRNTPEDLATMNEMQGRLQQAQEFVKSEQEKRSKPSNDAAAIDLQEQLGGQHEMPDGSVMPGAEHQEQPLRKGGKMLADLYEDGGHLRERVEGIQPMAMAGLADLGATQPLSTELAKSPVPVGDGAKGAGGPGAGAIVGAAGTAMELGNMAFGDTGIDTSGLTAAPEVQSQGMAAAGGAVKGASAGAAFGPWGAAIGGVLGGAAGLIGGGKAKRDANEAATNFTFGQQNKASNSYRSGGDLLANAYAEGGSLDPIQKAARLRETGTDMPTSDKYRDLDGSGLKSQLIADNLNNKDSHMSGFNTKSQELQDRDAAYGQVYRNEASKRKDLDYNDGKWSVLDDNQVKAYDEKYGEDYNTNYRGGGKMLANMYHEGGAPGHTHDIDFQAENDSFMNEQRVGQPLNTRPRATAIGVQGVGIQNVADLAPSTELMKRRDPNHDKGLDEVTGTKPRFNAGELLRYAPVAMNMAQLANQKAPASIGLDRLGNRYNEQRVDERGLQNTVQNSVSNNRDAILSSSGGSGSAARANLLASQLQGSKAESNAYQAAGAENRQDNIRGQQFNLGVDQANVSQSNQETNLNLEQQAAYKSNKSRLLSQIGNDLGGVGQEELFKRYPELMGLSYGAKGQHLSSEEARKAARKAATIKAAKQKINGLI